MSLQLTRELEELIQTKVRASHYDSANDLMREALELIDERELYIATNRDEIRYKIATGLKSLREGKGIDGDAFMAQMDAEHDEEIRLEDGVISG